jgi:hypothetical protein
MSVDWQNIKVPIVAGMNALTYAELLKAPEFLDIKNMEMVKAGHLQKRNGFTAMTRDYYSKPYSRAGNMGSGSLTDAKRLFSLDGELLLADGEYLYAYSAGSTKWVRNDRLPLFINSHRELMATDYSQQQVDHVECGDYGFTVWKTTGSASTDNMIGFCIEDRQGNTILSNDTEGSNGGTSDTYNPRVVKVSSTIVFIMYMEESAGLYDLKCMIFNTNTLLTDLASGSPTPVTIQAGCNGNVYDVVQSTSPSEIIAIMTNGTANPLLLSIAIDGSTVATHTGADFVNIACGMSVDVSGAKVAFAYRESATNDLRINTRNINGTFTNISGPTDVRAAAAHESLAILWRANGDDIDVYHDIDVTVSGNSFKDTYWDVFKSSTNTTTAKGLLIRRSCLGAKPFRKGSFNYLVIYYHGRESYQGSIFIYIHDTSQALTESATVCGRLLYSQTYGPRDGSTPVTPVTAWLPAVNASISDSNVYLFGAAKYTVLDLASADSGLSSVDPTVTRATKRRAVICKLDFTNTDSGFTLNVDGQTYITGGLLYRYDGLTVFENGHLTYPDVFITPTQDTSGSLTQTKVYVYRQYWEFTDAKGCRDISTTLKTYTAPVLTGTNDRNRFVIINPIHTRHKRTFDNYRFLMTRTEHTPSDGALLYRITSTAESGLTSSGDNNFPTLILNAASFTFDDAMGDSALVNNEIDYLSTGELDNVCVPSPSILGYAKNRMWAAGGEIPIGEVWYSKIKQPRKPIQFNDALTIKVGDNEPVTAIANLNDLVVIFKENSIYVVSGDGPTNTGVGEFSQPEKLSVDVGCINQRTVVNTPLGLTFFSNKGLYLLKPDLSVEYIGVATDDATITAAINNPIKKQVIFLQNSNNQTLFVWNYQFNVWSYFESDVADFIGTDITYDNGTLHVLGTSGYVYQLGTSGYFDGAGATKYTSSAKLGWATAESLMDYIRVKEIRVFGNFQQLLSTPKIRYYLDGSASGVDLTTMSLPTGAQKYLMAMPRTQKCRAFSLEIHDENYSASESLGWGISEFLFRIGLKNGGKPIESGRRTS